MILKDRCSNEYVFASQDIVFLQVKISFILYLRVPQVQIYCCGEKPVGEISRHECKAAGINLILNEYKFEFYQVSKIMKS